MLTIEEVTALHQILQRAPITQAEALWITALLSRLQAAAEEAVKQT